MLASILALLTLYLLGGDRAQALRVPLQARTNPHTSRDVSLPPYRHRLQPRANTTVSVTSAGNTQYLANFTLGGAEFVVTIDTGSSDLWIAGNIPTKQGLGKSASVHYAVGSASGEINTAVAEFGGFSVPDQAFIFVTDGKATGLDLSGFSGIIGLGPSSSSVVRQTIGQASADPFLDRVFRQNTSTPNFISFLLGREGDVGETIQGQLTIGEVIPGFENITNQPKIPVKALPGPLKVDQHWSGTLDGILGPDGKNIALDSLVPGTPSGQIVAIFDSGFTLPQVSRDISDAIYGRVQGASYDTTNGFWTIPCDQEVNLTVVIAGQNYPVHPLDTSSSDLNLTDVNGKKTCAGTFQPISTALDGTFDAVMGMAFLRNTYTFINFGDFVEGNPDNQGDPFMQLLSVTTPSEAHKDFVTIRLNGVDTTGDSAHALLPADQQQHSPSSTKEKVTNAFFRYWPWIAAAVGLVIVVGVAWLIFRCCCRRGGRGNRSVKGGMGRGKGMAVSGPYRPLHEPAPAPAMDLHAMGPPPQGAYADPYYRGSY